MSDQTVRSLSVHPVHDRATGPVVRLPIGAVRAGRPVRIGGVDAAHVRWLLGVAEEQLPPVVVRQETMSVVDGLHRLRAAELRGAAHITATLLECDDDLDAFIFTLLANKSGDGLPLTSADLAAAAEHLLRHRPQWSDRRIAAIAGVAPKRIARLRVHLGDGTEARVGRDGRARPTNSAWRRELVRELLLDQPHLSLREVARTVGVSPETVRAVRAGLCAENGRPVAPRAITTAVRTTGVSGRADESMDRAELLRRLRNDPALRSSHRGRALLRMLYLQLEVHESWTEIREYVPAHCHDSLKAFARQNAVIWRGLAQLLDRDLAS